jgi:hypothetical protein
MRAYEIVSADGIDALHLALRTSRTRPGVRLSGRRKPSWIVAGSPRLSHMKSGSFSSPWYRSATNSA